MLFFYLQKDKQIKRKILLLKKFCHTNGMLTIESLSKDLNVSRATILNDIETINNDTSCNVEIHNLFRKGLYLCLPKETSIETEIINLAKESTVFKIIDNIVTRELSFEECCSNLFVSRQTLLRIVKHMNKILADYSVKISYSRLKLKGKEENIRYFLYDFYKDFNHSFLSIPEDTISLSTGTSMKQNKQPTNLYSNHVINRIWLTIAKKRIEKGYYVRFPQNHQLMELKNEKAFLDFCLVYNTYLSIMNGQKMIPTDEYLWGYICYLHGVSYDICLREITTHTFSYCCKEEVYLAIKKYIKKAVHTFHLQTEELDLNGMISYLQNIRLLSLVTPLFQRTSSQLKGYVKLNFPVIFFKWLKFIKENPPEFMETVYIEDLAATLSLFTYSVQIRKMNKKILVFSFQGEVGLVYHLVELVKQMLPKEITPIYAVNKKITEKELADLKVNLLVCNHDYPQALPIEIHRLSYIPTDSEWLELREQIVALTQMVVV